MINYKRYAIEAAIGIVLLAMAYCSGQKSGQSNEKLAANQVQTEKDNKIIQANQVTVDSSKVRSDVLVRSRDSLRGRVHIVHDTIEVEPDSIGNDMETIVDSVVANLILKDDSTIKALSATVDNYGILVASLRVGISDRDNRIKLLESIKQPHFSNGLQTGVGYCQSLKGGVPCVYVGYGFSARF